MTRQQLDSWLDSNVHDWRWHFEAWLVNGPGEPGEALVDGLRGLVKDVNAALEDGDYVPPDEAAHTRTLAHEALQALDITAYQACNRDAFLASVEKARAILLSDRGTVEERLKKKIRQGREAGRPMAYQAADERVRLRFVF